MRFEPRPLDAPPILLLILLLAGTIPIYGQFHAGIQGTVTDPSGAAVPGATVTVTNKATDISRTTTTRGSGVYAVYGLTPGDYRIRVSKVGFKAQVLENVVVASQGVQAANVQLQLGAQTQNVTVTAPVTTLINTETGSISGTLTSQDIQMLPSLGRDPFKLARLTPGVFGDGALTSGGAASALPGNAGPGGSSAASSIFQTENQVQVSSNGSRTTSSDLQINGVGVNSVTWGGAATITPNEESIQSVQVVSNNYSALYGRNNGAQMIVTTQNGTNQYHGSAFFKWDRPGLDAYQAWNGPNNAPTFRDTDRFNQFGGSLGGPMLHNKLFGFFSYETLRDDSVATALGWYETPQFLSMAPKGSIASKLLTYPGEGVSYTQIVPEPCSFAGITNPSMCQPVDIGGKYAGLNVGSPLTTPLGTPDPTYVSPGNFGVGNGLNGIPDVMYAETTNPTTITDQQFNYRIDFQAAQNDLLSFTQYWVPETTTDYNGPVRAANLWHHHSINHAETGMWNHTFSPTLMNAARFGVSGWYWNEINTNPQEPWGLPEAMIDNFANVSDIMSDYFGPPGPSVFDQATFDARDTVTKVLNRHMLQFGGDITWLHYLSENASAARPTYNFRNLWDFLNDAPYQELGNFDPMTGQPTELAQQIRSENYAFYVQDNYKPKPSLTLNLGLRWEYFGPIHAAGNNMSNPVLGTSSDPLTGVSLKLGGNLYSTSPNNWGPQIGFAWGPKSIAGYSLNDRFVLRGGFGTAYDLTEEAVTVDGSSNPPFISSFTLTGNNILYSVPSSLTQFSNWPTNSAAVESFSPTTHLPVSGAPVTLYEIQNNLPTPVTYHYSLEAQYEFLPNWVATLGYEGSQTRHDTVLKNLTWGLYTPENPRVQSLYYFENQANASFDSLLAEVHHQVSHAVSLDAQFMWGRSIDEGSNDYYIDDYPYDVTYARGPSDYDVAQSFKLWGVWAPNFWAHRSGLLGKTLGGWELSGILELHTGFPWTPVYGNTGCNIIFQSSGYCDLRPAAYLGGTGTHYSNTTFMTAGGNFPKGALAYFTVPQFQKGPAFPATAPIPPAPGVSPNGFTGPGYRDFDAMLAKMFGLPKMKVLGENAQFELRGDFFNLFNTLNLTPFGVNSTSTIISTNGTASNPQFGQAQGALAGRIIELTARFSF
jgi:hypothetical protein